MLNALDDEGAAPAEVSVERDGLANAGYDRNVHEGVYLVSLTFCLVEEYDIDVGPRLGLGPGRAAALRQCFKHLGTSVIVMERARNDPFGKTVKGLKLWVRFSKLRTTVN